jgi:PAS domain S-box-containing protein
MGTATLDLLMDIYDKVQFSMILITPNGKIKYSNPATEEIFGFPQDDLVGKDFVGLDKYPGEMLNRLKNLESSILKGEKIEPIEFLACKSDKSLIWVNMVLIPIHLEDELLIQIMIQDVNERVHAELESVKNKARLEYLLSSSPAVIYSAKPSGNYAATFISPNIETVTGYSPEDFTADPDFWTKNVHPDDLESVLKGVPSIFEGGKYSYEYRFRCKNGDYIWVLDSIELIYDETGSPMEIIGYWADISARKRAEGALQESEEKYRQLVENMNDGLTVINREGYFTYVNGRICEMLGYSRDELLDTSWEILFDDQNREIVRSHVSRRKKGEKSTYEVSWIGKNGKKVHTIVAGQAIFDQSGEYTGSFAVITDISDRMEAEKRIIESEEKYRNLFENMSSGVAIYEVVNNGQDFIFKDFNKAAEMIERISKKEVLNKSIMEVFPRIGNFGLLDVFEKVWKTGIPARFPAAFYEDERISGWRDNFVYKLDSGEIVTVYDDITFQREAEQKLRESEAKYRFIVENANDLIAIINRKFELEFFNEEAAQRILNYTKEDVLGRNLVEMAHPEDRERVLQILMDGMKRGEAEAEFKFPAKNGIYRWFEVRGRAFLDEKGELKGIIVARDISERKEAERKLRESEEKYRFVTDNMVDVVAVLNKDLKIEFINDTQQNLTGFTLDEMKGKLVTDFIHPDDITRAFKIYEKALKLGEGRGEFRMRQKGGAYVWVDMVGRIIYDEDNEPKAVLVSRDIDDQRRLQEQVTESEELFKTIAEQTSMGIIITQEGEILFINESAAAITGRTPQEVEERSISEFMDTIHPDDIRAVAEAMRALEGGESPYGDARIVRIKTQSGGLRYVEVVTKLINYHGKVAALSTLMDLTVRLEIEEKLKISERKFRDMVDLLPDIIFETNKELKITYTNPIGLKKFGVTREEIDKGIDLMEMVAKESYALAKRGLDAVLEGIKGVPGDYLVKKKDGSAFWARVYVAPIIRDDQVDGLRGLVSDISRRKQAELQLKESEEKFKMITEQSLMSILILQDGIVKYANDAATTISEFTLEEILDWPPNYFINLIHSDDQKFVMEQARLKQSGKSGAVDHYYYRLYTKSRKLRWISQYSKTVSYQGRPADLVTLIDITERMEAEQRLRESEEHFKTISEQLLMGICILQDDKVKYLNQEYADLFGYTMEDMMRWEPLEFMKAVHPKDKRRIILKEQEKRDPATKDSIQYAFRGIRKSGEVIWLECYSKLIDYRGKPADLIMVTDITGRVEAERSLKESETQYREAFNRAEFYKDLLSHDVSNILQSIMFSAESALFMLDDMDALTKRLNIIKGEIKRSARIITNVRKLSMLERGESNVFPVDALLFIKRSLEFIHSKYINKNITTTFDVFDQKVFVLANDLLLDVFENILDNSVKYNDSSAVELFVRINKELQDGIYYIRLEFIDNGIGVKDEHKASIFERGYREGRNISGRGLGLSLSSKILKSIGGKIWVEDRVKDDYQKGCNFIILIPKV